MADTIIRLKVESTEYENRLKRAVQGMQQLEKHVREMGAGFEVAEKADLEFVRALGDMETQTQSVKGQMREFTEAILALKQQYDRLTDEEKFGEWGQAMIGSIDKLKVRAADLKDEMGDLDEELKNMASDTAFTDGVGMMTRTIGACSAAITVWTSDSKEMEQVIKDLAKIGATVAAVEELTTVFQKQNLVLLKNPYVIAATAAAGMAIAIGKIIKKSKELSAVEQSLYDVQKKGREDSAKEVTRIETLNTILRDNTRSLEERRTALAQIQSLVPDYHGALTEEGTLINDNTGALTDYINELQRAATAQAAFDRMVELQRRRMDQTLELQTRQNNLAAAEARRERTQNSVVHAGSEMSIVYDQIDISGLERAVRETEAEIRATDAEIQALQDLVNASDLSSTNRTNTRNTTRSSQSTTTDEVLPEGSIAALRKNIAEVRNEWELAISDEQREEKSKELAKLEADLDKLLGKVVNVGYKAENIKFNMDGLSDVSQYLNDLLQSAEIDTSDYILRAENIADLGEFQRLLKIATENGISVADFNAFKDSFDKLKLGLDIDDNTWDKLKEDIKAKLEEMGIELPVELKVKTDKSGDDVAKNASTAADAWQAAATAVGNLGSALQSVEDPSSKVAGIVMQAIANIALGFAQAAASQATGAAGVFGWIAAATAGVATMTATIASIKSATKFADGGMVGGNSYSGDNIVARLNSGEGVLTANGVRNAQTMAANANTWGNLQLEALISGESLRLVLANNASRRGGNRSQYAITKFG